jgi:hypothetical protein
MLILGANRMQDNRRAARTIVKAHDMADPAKPPAIEDTRKPALAFRVAISGARALPAAGSDARTAIAAQVDGVLAAIHARIAKVQASARAGACYAQDRPARLVCLSPLADGADRVFAQSALDLADRSQGSAIAVELRVALPFDIDSYKASFGGVDGRDRGQSGRDFDRLLGRAAAAPLVLDGAAGESTVRHDSYGAVGRTVARNCDLLVAIWDKRSDSSGGGGTGDIVRFALHAGIPIWWIDACGTGQAALWTAPADVDHIVDAGEAAGALDTVIDDTLIPPPGEALPPSLFSENEPDPLGAFFQEPLVTNRHFWLCHAGVVGALRRGLAKPATEQDLALGYVSRAQNWRDSHLIKCVCAPHRRDRFSPGRTLSSQISGSYQHGYRTSYFFIFMLAAFALITAVLGVGHYLGELVSSALELGALLAIALLVMVNRRHGWHRRYLDYRLLSELVRPSPFLAPLGWNLPFSRMRRAVEANDDAWVSWLAAAYVRAAPLPAGALRDALPDLQRNLADRFVGSQIEFHIRRKLECGGANAAFGTAGRYLFIATLGGVFIKLIFASAEHFGFALHVPGTQITIARHTADVVGLITAMAPALSAASFGMQAYEEFESLAESSQEMIGHLVAARDRINAVDLARPLASQKLAEAGLDAALIMLSEASGWASLLRTKGIEAA